MKTRLRIQTEALAQIERADRWWTEHRSTAPLLFTEELEHAFARLEHNPAIGRPVHRTDVPGLRVLNLPKTRNQIYYVHEDGEVVVLAVWSAVRGRGPSIRARKAPKR